MHGEPGRNIDVPKDIRTAVPLTGITASLTSLRSSLASIQWGRETVRESLDARRSYDKGGGHDGVPRELQETLIRAEVGVTCAQHS